MVNVLIVNYNTQKLTNACICSVNKFTPDATIQYTQKCTSIR